MTAAVWRRLAIALAAVLCLGGLAATFLPSTPEGVTCGTWVAPEWEDDASSDLVDDYLDMAGQGDAFGLGDQARAGAASVIRAKRLCDDTLGGRRTLTIVLLGAALVVPVGLLFVAGAAGRGARDDA